MKCCRLISVLIALIWLSGCSTHHYALGVAPGNTDWKVTDDSVIVLLGYLSDKPVTSVTRSDDDEAIPLTVWHGATNELAVLALHQRVGESFGLKQLTYATEASKPIVESKWKQLDFNHLPELSTPERGIYFYGVVSIQNDRASFSKDKDLMDRLIQLARQDYPGAFDALPMIMN